MLYLFAIIAGDPATYSFANVISVGLVLVNLLLGFAIGIAVIAVLWAAYIYMSSFGSEERAKQAKNVLYWTFIGLAVMLLARFIVATGLRVISPSGKIIEDLRKNTQFQNGNGSQESLFK